MSLAYTKSIEVNDTPVKILGYDGNRLELTIFNKSTEDYLYIGFGSENDIFSINNTLPLAPGESYDSTVPPKNAVFLLTEGVTLNPVVYFSTQSPAYVSGALGGSVNV